MLATFASILPSGITFSSNNKGDDAKDRRDLEIANVNSHPDQQHSQGSQAHRDDSGKERETMATTDEMGVKKKRERSANETFIVVRPPPSVSNHPLNLQLQLVPPQVKERPRRSVDDAAQDAASIASTNASVGRAPSIRSNRSDISSFYSSSASMTSVSSLASAASSSVSGSGRRMIIPLYNLSAHNVMTNTVLDAGTDAKVAKFTKRGMEIIGLAVLEPMEVWSGGGNGTSPTSDMLLRVGSIDDGAHTPTSSALSISSAGVGDVGTNAKIYNAPLPPLPAEPSSTPTQSGAKKLFGKIFKKRDSDAQMGHSRGNSTGSVTMPNIPISPLTRRSFAPARQPPASPPPTTSEARQAINLTANSGSALSQPGTPTQAVLRPPVLGIQATVLSSTYPPLGRPTRYVWVVRKWLKGNEGGLLGGVNVGINAVMKGMRGLSGSERSGGPSRGSLGNIGEVGEGVEVRFEWVRGTAKHSKRASTQPTSSAPNRRSSVHAPPELQLSAHTHEASQASERRLSAIRPGTATSVDSRRAPSPLSNKRDGSGHITVVQPSDHDQESITHSVDDSEEGAWEGQGTGPSARSPGVREKRASHATSATRQSQSREDDDGDESDPEDSETPWSCAMTIHAIQGRGDIERERERELLAAAAQSSGRMKSGVTPTTSQITPPQLVAHASGSSTTTTSTMHSPPTSQTHAARTSASVSPNAPPPPPAPLLRLKIATLSPAPHHPKVVAQLKVPFPLPDVEIDRARARKRVLGPSGIPVARAPSGRDGDDDEDAEQGGNGGRLGRRGSSGTSGAGRYEGLMLTAEEIKDVLSSTAFWVVVREGLGGVGKVNRKGDGWRIRG